MTSAIPAEIPADQQVTAARAGLALARDHRHQASAALDAARAAYETARRHNPAGQDTDQARHAWREAASDLLDAQIAVEQARDELNALLQETADHAVTPSPQEGRDA